MPGVMLLMMQIAQTICVVAAATEPPTFEVYTQQFSKQYSSVGERMLRKTVYEGNVRRIVASNAEPSTGSYRLGVNHLTDMTFAEIKSGGWALRQTTQVSLLAPLRSLAPPVPSPSCTLPASRNA